MKAKEYAEKYKDLTTPEVANNDKLFVKRLSELRNDMFAEMTSLAEARNIKTLSGLKSLEKEFNEKGNRISKLLNGILKDNWFSIVLKDAMEEVDKENATD